MNEKFFSLPEDRQHVMLNAGFAVFSRNAYKKASMDDVAREAGVSKALLFHYFESKSGLYLYLHHYAMSACRASCTPTARRTSSRFWRAARRSSWKSCAIIPTSCSSW